MGREAWQDNFRRRCDYVGWVTDLSTGSNHYKVYDAKGKYLFTYAKTAGDRRAMLNTLSEAKRHGLEILEQQEKLRRERDRLVRIEKDRETNGFVVADVQSANTATSEREKDIPVATIANHYAENRDAVLGVKVLIRQTAHLTGINYATQQLDSRPYPDIDELQLENETVVYQCASRYDSSCLFTAAKSQSIRAHLRAHAPRAQARALAAKLAEAEAELQAQKAKTKTNVAQNGDLRDPTDTDHAVIDRIKKTADSLAHELEELSRGMQFVGKSLTQLSADLDRIPTVDPKLIDKARAFDDLQAILGRTQTS